MSPTTRARYIYNVKKFSLHFGRSLIVSALITLAPTRFTWCLRALLGRHSTKSSPRCVFFGVTLGREDLPERIAYARRSKWLTKNLGKVMVQPYPSPCPDILITSYNI